MNLYQHAKNKFIPSAHSWDTANFRVLWPGRPHPFLTMLMKKFFDELLIFVILYQHTKNQAISWICSGDIVDLKMLQCDWLRAFCPISQEHSNTANDISFYYITNSVKINDHIFQIQKTYFWPFFDPFFQFFVTKKSFSKKSGTVAQNVLWVFSTMSKFRKKLIFPFQENVRTDGRTSERANRLYFKVPFQLPPEGHTRGIESEGIERNQWRKVG